MSYSEAEEALRDSEAAGTRAGRNLEDSTIIGGDMILVIQKRAYEVVMNSSTLAASATAVRAE